MLDLLADLVSLLLCWNHDPDIDSVRGGIAILFLVVFVLAVLFLSGAIVAFRQG